MRRTGRIRHCGRAALFAAALLLAVPSAIAQTNPVAEIARYEGTDREQRLIEGAKREKELTLLFVDPAGRHRRPGGAFDKKYGVKVKVWRADSESLLQRITDEAKARRYEVDIMAGSSSALEPLYRENLLQEVKSPYLADLIRRRSRRTGSGRRSFSTPSCRPTTPIWCARRDCRRPLRTCSRRSGRASSGSRPRTTTGSRRWSSTSARRRGCDCSATSWPPTASRCARATTLLNNLVAGGEVPAGAHRLRLLGRAGQAQGRALDWFVIPPAIARPTCARSGAQCTPSARGGAVLRFPDRGGAADPGQPPIRHRQPQDRSRRSTASPLQLIDSTMMLDHARKWQELFQRTIVGPSR